MTPLGEAADGREGCEKRQSDRPSGARLVTFTCGCYPRGPVFAAISSLLVPMPQYAEYVFAAYGLFVVVIGGYVVWLLIRLRAARRTLEALERARKSRTP